MPPCHTAAKKPEPNPRTPRRSTLLLPTAHALDARQVNPAVHMAATEDHAWEAWEASVDAFCVGDRSTASCDAGAAEWDLPCAQVPEISAVSLPSGGIWVDACARSDAAVACSKNKHINDALLGCRDASDLCAVIARYKDLFNEVNVATAFTLGLRLTPGEQGVEKHTETLLRAKMATLGGEQLANILNALVKTPGAGSRLGVLEALEGQARAEAHTFTQRHLSTVIWAWAKLRWECARETMSAMEACIASSPQAFNPQSISNILWAFAVQNHLPASNVMQRLEQDLDVRSYMFTTQTLGTILWAYGRLEWMPSSTLCGALQERIVDMHGALNSQNVSNVVWGCGKLELSVREDALQALQSRIGTLIPEFEEKSLCHTLWGFATLHRTLPASLLALYELRIRAVVETLDSQAVSVLLWAFATLGHCPSDELMQKLEARTEHPSVQLTAQGASNILWAYGTLGLKPGRTVLAKIGAAATRHMDTCTQQNLANLLWAYAKMQVMPEQDVCTACEQRIRATGREFGIRYLANILWAYATLGLVPACTEMHVLTAAVCSSSKAYNMQDTTNVLWAMTVFAVLEKRADVHRSMDAVCTRLLSPTVLAGANKENLCQLHQLFVTMDMLGRPAVDDAFAARCRKAFIESSARASQKQLQVARVLRQMGLNVQEEDVCAKLGYSIDMRVEGWFPCAQKRAVVSIEFDGPSHFLTNRAPTGNTVLKHAHLRHFGHVLVTVPFYEWGACTTTLQRRAYLTAKLGDAVRKQ